MTRAHTGSSLLTQTNAWASYGFRLDGKRHDFASDTSDRRNGSPPTRVRVCGRDTGLTERRVGCVSAGERECATPPHCKRGLGRSGRGLAWGSAALRQRVEMFLPLSQRPALGQAHGSFLAIWRKTGNAPARPLTSDHTRPGGFSIPGLQISVGWDGAP